MTAYVGNPSRKRRPIRPQRPAPALQMKQSVNRFGALAVAHDSQCDSRDLRHAFVTSDLSPARASCEETPSQIEHDDLASAVEML